MLQNNENVHFLVQKVEKDGNFVFWLASKSMVISGLPMGHRYWKYVSLCWSNSYIMANAPGGRAQ